MIIKNRKAPVGPVKRKRLICDICGYKDATQQKTAVRKHDDGIIRCRHCCIKLGMEEGDW